MNTKIEIVEFIQFTDTLSQMIKSSTLIPVIGAGFSCDCKTTRGIVPNGSSMKKHMIKELNKNKKVTAIDKKSFSQVAKYYNRLIDEQVRKEYLSRNFLGAKLSCPKINFLSIKWPYIYTLNIDDAIEKNSNYQAVGPNKKIQDNIFHYGDVVFKLHGNASEMVYLKEGEKFSVFDTDQYIDSLESNRWLLNQLKQDYIDKNILFIGCSLDDEIDLMHVFSLIKNKRTSRVIKRFFVTDKQLEDTDLIDLESYGITTILHVESYDEFYNAFYNIKRQVQYCETNQLDYYKNIPVVQLDARNQSNKDYIIYEKIPFDTKSNKIILPYHFVKRKLSTKIINDFNTFALQIIYGKRISGKSYLLLDIYNQVHDRDKYYFDSRTRISKDNIDYLLNLKNALILIDTNVLFDNNLSYLLNYKLEKLVERNINIIVCVNISKKGEAIELHKANKNPLIEMHYLENKFSFNSQDDEYENLRRQMAAINMPYFAKDKTILDSIIEIQNNLSKQHKNTLSNFNVDPNNYLHIVYLMLLANNGKITSADMVKFCLNDEPYELMNKLDKAVEPDFRKMITSSIFDNSYYQIICNAQAWLLGYLSSISLKYSYFNSIIKAVVYIVQQINDSPSSREEKKKEIFEFIKFDNINLILGGARAGRNPSGVRRLIQTIYSELKPILGEDYQFNHQHAKCLLWGIEELNEPERSKDLTKALQSMLLSIQLINEALKNNPKNKYLKVSLAHAQFTLSMIRVKEFFFNPSEETFSKGVSQLFDALQYHENLNAYELYDEISENDENDYSISRFMDYILNEESMQYRGATDRRKLDYIASFRIKHPLDT